MKLTDFFIDFDYNRFLVFSGSLMIMLLSIAMLGLLLLMTFSGKQK